MKIFITGGQGFIAKNLIEFYHEHDLFEYQRDSIVQNDLKKFNPDVILHCAAEIYKSELMWNSNVILTHDILEYVKEFPNTKLIFIGSSSVCLSNSSISKSMFSQSLISSISLSRFSSVKANL